MSRNISVRPPLRSTDERNNLALQNKGLVHHTVIRAIRAGHLLGMSEEDALQVAWLGMLRAAELWEANKGPLSTYATHYMLYYLREANLKNNTIRVPKHQLWETTTNSNIARARQTFRTKVEKATSRTPYLEEDTVARSSPDPGTQYDVAQAINHLTPRWRKIVHMRYWQGLSYKEIGQKLGITSQRVSQILMHARRRIRTHLPAYEPDLTR